MFSNSNKMLSKTCVRADNVNTVIIIYGGVTVFVVIIIRGLNVLEINTEVVVRNLISIISGKKNPLSFWMDGCCYRNFFDNIDCSGSTFIKFPPIYEWKIEHIFIYVNCDMDVLCNNHNNFQKLFMTTIYKNMKV